MIKFVRIVAPKRYLTPPFTELEAIRLVNQNCIPCRMSRILLLLRSRLPFHASFQRFEGDFEGVFLFYFRWGFEENEKIDQIH